jgi:hypothetical protein
MDPPCSRQHTGRSFAFLDIQLIRVCCPFVSESKDTYADRVTLIMAGPPMRFVWTVVVIVCSLELPVCDCENSSLHATLCWCGCAGSSNLIGQGERFSGTFGSREQPEISSTAPGTRFDCSIQWDHGGDRQCHERRRPTGRMLCHDGYYDR